MTMRNEKKTAIHQNCVEGNATTTTTTSKSFDENEICIIRKYVKSARAIRDKLLLGMPIAD